MHLIEIACAGVGRTLCEVCARGTRRCRGKRGKAYPMYSMGICLLREQAPDSTRRRGDRSSARGGTTAPYWREAQVRVPSSRPFVLGALYLCEQANLRAGGEQRVRGHAGRGFEGAWGWVVHGHQNETRPSLRTVGHLDRRSTSTSTRPRPSAIAAKQRSIFFRFCCFAADL